MAASAPFPKRLAPARNRWKPIGRLFAPRKKQTLRRGTKLQAPTSKLQRNSKRQTSNVPRVGFETWLLKFLWMLELGYWSFCLPILSTENIGAVESFRLYFAIGKTKLLRLLQAGGVLLKPLIIRVGHGRQSLFGMFDDVIRNGRIHPLMSFRVTIRKGQRPAAAVIIGRIIIPGGMVRIHVHAKQSVID